MNNEQSNLNQQNPELKKENRRLQRELAHKEKALAEAAVLLTLKKVPQSLCQRRRLNRVHERQKILDFIAATKTGGVQERTTCLFQ